MVLRGKINNRRDYFRNANVEKVQIGARGPNVRTVKTTRTETPRAVITRTENRQGGKIRSIASSYVPIQQQQRVQAPQPRMSNIGQSIGLNIGFNPVGNIFNAVEQHSLKYAKIKKENALQKRIKSQTFTIDDAFGGFL